MSSGEFWKEAGIVALGFVPVLLTIWLAHKALPKHDAAGDPQAKGGQHPNQQNQKPRRPWAHGVEEMPVRRI